MGTTFIEDELLKRSSSGILSPMRAGDVIQSPGLEDLIAGVTPTLVSWTNPPTDAADITDGDPTTFCTTGNRVMNSPWGYAYFEWDFGSMYTVLVGGVGAVATDTGNTRCYIETWNGSGWIRSRLEIGTDWNVRMFDPVAAMGSKVRLGITCNSASTITPNIREFHAWRL